MPDWTQGRPARNTGAPVRNWQRPQVERPTAVDPEDDVATPDEGSSVIPALAGGAAALGGIALLAKAPGMIGKVARGANAVRMQAMLSGLAVPKSLLGNIGSAAIESAERGTIRPLRELFRLRTLKDAATAYKNYGQAGPAAAGANIPVVPVPGRVMGAFDVATQNALQRAGLTAQESERAVLQAPLTGRLASALDSPAARYMLPFRRTPFNQFLEGLETIKPDNLKKHPALNALIYSAGATHGAMTADEEYPLSIGLGTAAASRYGLPYAVAAILGRELAGGKGSERLSGSVLPVSEYGFTSGITQPLRPFYRPAIRSLLEGQ